MDVAPVLAVTTVGQGPAVVCLHGQPGSAQDWSLLAAELRSDFTVVAVDRPGYGRTGGRAGGFAANARAVIATLDDLGVDRAVMVGHSWAGGVAQILAADHPDRVSGLVLVSSIGPGAGPGWADRILAAPVLGDVMIASSFAIARTLLGSARIRSRLDQVLPGASHTVMAAISGDIDVAVGGTTGDAIAGSANPASGPAGGTPLWRSFVAEQRVFVAEIQFLGGALGRIKTPCVVMVGTADHVVTPEVGARLAVAIPGAILRTVTDAGHLLPFDHPAEVASAVRKVSA